MATFMRLKIGKSFNGLPLMWALLCVLGLSDRALSQTVSDVQWYSWEPRVISVDQVEPITFTAMVLGNPENLRISLQDGSSKLLSSIGGDLYQTTLAADQLLFDYQDGDAHNHVGYLELPGPCPPLQNGCLNLFVNVRSELMPDVSVVELAPDVQMSDHVINLKYDTLLFNATPEEPLQRFYELLDDDFDFIAVIEQVSYVANRFYRGMRNDVSGIGLVDFDIATQMGIPPRLRGLIHFPIDSFFDLASKTASHEIGHRWINFLDHSLLSPGQPHWPVADIGNSIMGVSIAGSGVGGEFPYTLVELPNGDVEVQLSDVVNEFNDLELYLMGLLPPEEVGEHFVLPGVLQVSVGEIIPGPVSRFTIDDIIAVDGPRLPAAGDAQTDFRIATIILSRDELLSSNEMAFFDHMSARGEGVNEVPFTSGFARGMTKPFYLATGGRATLSSTLTADSNTGNFFSDLVSLADVNGNNNTDLGVLLRDSDASKNVLTVLDGGTGDTITTVSFGSDPAKGSTSVPDSTGDLVPEYAVLREGSFLAQVKDVVNGTLLGKPRFSASFAPVAVLSADSDLAVVGRNTDNGKVQVQIKDIESGSLVSRFDFSKDYLPFDAVAVDNVGDSAAMEIAVLGIDADGDVRAQIKDAQSGNLIGKIKFNKAFTPLAFIAVPDANGDRTNLAVLGRNASGVIQAQIKRASDGTLVNKVKFSKSYDPRAFIGFADSNGSGGGEIAVIGVNEAGKIRAQVKEIEDGTWVNEINFSSSFPPVDAIALNGAAGTGRNEIAVLGQNVSGEFQVQVKDLLGGDLVSKTIVP